MRIPLLFRAFGIVISLLPAQAQALSCPYYDAISAFGDADQSKQLYKAVVGTLSFDESHLPSVDWDHQEDVQPDNFLMGHVAGHGLTHAGFSAPFEQDIKINVQCAGPWCSGLSDGHSLLFLQKTLDGYLLEVNPCGGFAFHAPQDDMLHTIKACLNNGGCAPELPLPTTQ